MKIKLILSSLIILVTVVHASFIIEPMQNQPPSEDQIGEIMFYSTDFFINNTRYITIPREQFLNFFRKGKFSNDPKIIDEIKKMPEDKNMGGGQNLCTGHFATKDGKLFSFNRYNPKVIQITDVDGKSCWFVLP